MSHVAVIDIGKTNVKSVLVETGTMSELAVVTRPNTVLPGPPWPHFDLDGHWVFLLAALAAFQRDYGIDAISITAHGAGGVLLDENGNPAAPMLDYEHSGPDILAEEYDAIRPEFTETGSPRLPMGLNLGAQLYWMFNTDPSLRERTAAFVTYPQYWAFRLTGVAATDVTSLGCHTDLWAPRAGGFSSLVRKLGLEGKIPPVRPSADMLGSVTPEIAEQAGLRPGTPVHCGIHDSNASLLPHILSRKPPFSVISTGTWVVAMSIGGQPVDLDPSRDTLININALGDNVPSARFMGGREFETVLSDQIKYPGKSEINRVLTNGTMLLPAVNQESGPFSGRHAEWLGGEPGPGSGERTAAASFYLALMTAACLSLTGHKGRIIVEGPFAGNIPYCRMLSAATDCSVTAVRRAAGTSCGAALLAGGSPVGLSSEGDTRIYEISPEMRTYAERWIYAADSRS